MTDATKEEPPLDPHAAKDGPKGKGMAAHMVHHRAPNTNHSDPEHPLSCIRSERLAIASFLEGNFVSSVILALVLVEMICVIFEMLLASEHLDLRGHDYRELMYQAVYMLNATEKGTSTAWLDSKFGVGSTALGGVQLDEAIACAYPVLCHTCCDNINYHWHHTLHIMSLSIIVLFAVEIAFLIFALGPISYAKHFWYMLDFVLVYVTLFSEVFLNHDEIAVLTFLRSWRFVRIMHSFVSTLEAHHEAQHDTKHMEQVLKAMLLTKNQAANEIADVLQQYHGKSAEDLDIHHMLMSDVQHAQHIEIIMESEDESDIRKTAQEEAAATMIQAQFRGNKVRQGEGEGEAEGEGEDEGEGAEPEGEGAEPEGEGEQVEVES